MKENNCIFCDIIEKKSPAFFIYEDDLIIAILDKYPQTQGHIQVIPKDHYRYIYDHPRIGEIFTTISKIIHVIIQVLGADHVTLGAFGHQVKHAHVWVVPQYKKVINIRENVVSGSDLNSQESLRELLKAALIKGGVR